MAAVAERRVARGDQEACVGEAEVGRLPNTKVTRKKNTKKKQKLEILRRGIELKNHSFGTERFPDCTKNT